ncbi:hypothetical protein KY284_010452 [Solanum tuberosum]|nr:hypothetical protein KY284_010452 [Solanum tuberosum]
MEIEILCKKLIKPCLPTPPHLQRYKLSFFDQISEKEHVPIVLFYANNNFINNSTIDKRVEQSFSKVLTHVYPAARRYDKDECSILCLDQALLWRAYIRASATINGYIRPSLMALPLNLRAKTSLPQVHNSMGNFRIDVPIKFISGETKKELHNYIILIRNAMNKVVASCTKASPDEIVSTVINTYNESFEAPKWGGNDGVDKVVCSSLCNFPFHDTDFGLEKPTLLFFGMKDIQMFWLYDTDIHSEVGVQVDLKESYMQLFECDDDIKAFTFIHNANL